MTITQAEQFWKEWQEFKTRWGIRLESDGNDYVRARFDDDSFIWLDNELDPCFLKSGELSCPATAATSDIARRTAISEWGRG